MNKYLCHKIRVWGFFYLNTVRVRINITTMHRKNMPAKIYAHLVRMPAACGACRSKRRAIRFENTDI